MITGKPTEVRDISATSTCDSIKLNWKPPVDDGGMPITKYVLDYLDVRRNVDGKETSYTIRELERNTLYVIQIRATNKGEWGPISKKEGRTKEFCKYLKFYFCLFLFCFAKIAVLRKYMVVVNFLIKLN